MTRCGRSTSGRCFLDGSTREPLSYMGVIPTTGRCESVTYLLGLSVTYQPDCSARGAARFGAMYRSNQTEAWTS
jgi:hypothetical protein